MDDTWIQNLTEGDEVFVSRGSYGLNFDRRKVEKVTKTQVIVAGQRINKKWNSVVCGRTWNTTHLVQITPESESKYRKGLLKRKAIDLKSRMMVPDTEESLLRFIHFAKQFVPVKKEE